VQQRARLRKYGRRYGPAEQFPLVFIDHINGVTALIVKQAAQCFDPAEMQRGDGRLHMRGRHHGFVDGRTRTVAAPAFQPQDAADADSGGELRQ
jgi:hypothetical protein